MKSLAENVRTARLFNGWTQEQLAQRAGVSQTTIDKIEQGKTLKTKFLANIALALDVPAEHLDPELAKAKEAWNKSLKEHPENFYVMKTIENIPMCAIQRQSDQYIFVIEPKPISNVPAPRWLDGRRIVCVQWDIDCINSELGRGDALFFELGAAIYVGKFGLFMSNSYASGPCIYAKLVMADDDYLTVKLVDENEVRKLPTKDWPDFAPLRVRYIAEADGDK